MTHTMKNNEASSDKTVKCNNRNKVSKSKSNQLSQDDNAPRLHVKVDAINVKQHIQKLDKNLIDLCTANIYNKTVSKANKQIHIVTVLNYLEGITPISLFKRRALFAFEACLKYGYEASRNRVCKMFIDNRKGIMKSIFGLRCFVKILKYAPAQWKDLCFITLIDKLIMDLNREKSMYFANKCFLLLSEKQKRQLFASFIGENPNDEKVFKKSFVGVWRETFTDKFNLKLKELSEYIKHCEDNNILSFEFVHFIINTILSELTQDEIQNIMPIFHTLDMLKNRFLCTNDGLLILSKYLPTLNDEQSENVVTLVQPHMMDISYLDNSYIFFITLTHSSIYSKLIISALFPYLIENLSTIINEPHWYKFIIYLLCPHGNEAELTLTPMNIHPNTLKCIRYIKQQYKNSVYTFDDHFAEICPVLKEYVLTNIINILLDPSKDSLTLACINKFPAEARVEIFKKIIDILIDPVHQNMISSVKSFHIILSKIIMNDKKEYDSNLPSFNIMLAEALDSITLKSWLQTTRCSFIIVRLLETNIQQVVEILKQKLPKVLEETTSGPTNVFDIIKKYLD